MKTKLFILIALFVAVCSFSAEAQLGGLLNKAKDLAKDKTKNIAEDKVTDTKDKVEDKAKDAVNQATNSTDDTDKANNQDPIATISMAELKESYKKLNYDIYIPASKSFRFLFTYKIYEDNEELDPLRTLLLKMIASGGESPCIVYKGYQIFVLPADAIINASFALFQAFPAETYPFFMEARMLIHAMDEGKINLDYENTNTLVVNYSGGGYGPERYEYDRSKNVEKGFGFKSNMIVGAPKEGGNKLAQWKSEEARLMKLFRENVPFERVKNTFINTMIATVNYSKEKDWNNGVYESYKLAVAAEDMKSHPNKIEDEDYTYALQTYEQLKTNNYPKWEAVVKKNWMEEYDFIKKDINRTYGIYEIVKAEIPKPAVRDAKLEAQLLAATNSMLINWPNDGRIPVKVILTEVNWKHQRNAFGVILGRGRNAKVIYKMPNGKYYMRDAYYNQDFDGVNYGPIKGNTIGYDYIVDYK
ncbi:MAG TPA: antitoxin [Bacteroidales bacterium]|nr:antitoxin [Bacteroidales bacterium]